MNVKKIFYCILYSHLIYSTSHFILLWSFPLLLGAFYFHRTNTHIFVRLIQFTRCSVVCASKMKAFKNNLKGLFTLFASYKNFSFMKCIIKSPVCNNGQSRKVFFKRVFHVNSLRENYFEYV